MDIRRLTRDYAVSPQIAPEDVAAIAAAGFTTLICNRPDQEVPPDLRAEPIRAAAEAAGLVFVDLPILPQGIGPEMIRRHAEAIAASDGPTLAYCNSGTRSTVIWMFGAATSMPAQDLIDIAARAGYPLADLRPTLEYLAAR